MRKLALATLLTAISAQAFAAQGEVCATEPKAPTDPSALHVTNEAVFKCPTAGDVTIPQVYEKGWRVVQLSSGMPTVGRTSMPSIAHVILIEKI